MEKYHIANLAFLLNYEDGDTIDEIESDLYRLALQRKEAIHYDRDMGGSFQDLEQEPGNIGAILKFTSNFIESVYRLNAERDFDPYVIVGFSDINIDEDLANGKYTVYVQYRLLQDLNLVGQISL